MITIPYMVSSLILAGSIGVFIGRREGHRAAIDQVVEDLGRTRTAFVGDRVICGDVQSLNTWIKGPEYALPSTTLPHVELPFADSELPHTECGQRKHVGQIIVKGIHRAERETIPAYRHPFLTTEGIG